MKKMNEESSGELRRAYPIHCINCGKKEVYPALVRETVKQNHDGRVYELAVDNLPVAKCRSCGEMSYAQDAGDRIAEVLRETLGLLTPDQIRASLQKLHMNQRTAALSLGVAPETLSRWLTGGLIQSRAMDNLLRAFFASADVRKGLANAKSRARFGTRVAAS